MAVRKRVKKIIRRSSNSSKNQQNVNNAKQTVKINIGGVNPGQPGSRPFQGGSTSIVFPGPPPPPQTPWTIIEKNYVENNPFKSIPQGQRAVSELGAPMAPIAIGANGPEPIVNSLGGGMNVEQPRSVNDTEAQRPNSFYENALGNTIGIAPHVPKPTDNASGEQRLISGNMGRIEPMIDAEEHKHASASSSSTAVGDAIGNTEDYHTIDEQFTKAQLKKILTESGVSYRSSENKPDLIHKFIKLKSK
jgi:hypothetical protein